MALKALLDSTAWGGLDPIVQAEYTQVGEGYVLQVEDDIRDHPKVKALKVALDRTKLEKKALQDKLTPLEAKIAGLPDDFDPEQFARDMDELVELREKVKKKKPGDDDPTGTAEKRLYEQRIAALEKKHGEEKVALETEKRDLIKEIERLVADEGLTKALVAVGVEKKLMPGATALLRRSIKVRREEAGEWTGYFETDLGETSITDYVQTWAQSDEGSIYVAKIKGGGGNGSDGTRSVDNPFIAPKGPDGKPTGKPNLTRQQDLIKANPDKARQLAQQAGVVPTW